MARTFDFNALAICVILGNLGGISRKRVEWYMSVVKIDEYIVVFPIRLGW